jgi:hypothetical protein
LDELPGAGRRELEGCGGCKLALRVLEFRLKRQELGLAELEKLIKADNSCQGLAGAAGVQDLLRWLVIDRKFSFFTLLFPFINKLPEVVLLLWPHTVQIPSRKCCCLDRDTVHSYYFEAPVKEKFFR